jgi:NIMA (never in mitosis gene a)-related kinase
MNILLSAERHVKIGDLGASKITTAASQMHVTRVGTPLYLAPELVKQHPYDFKADIWAMGCVLYHLASFESPFRGENLVALGNAIVTKKPKPLPPCYSGRLSAMIFRLLEKKASDRPNIFQVLQMIPSTVRHKYIEPAPPPFQGFGETTTNDSTKLERT